MITHLTLDLDGTLVDWKPFQASSLFVVRMLQALSKEMSYKQAIESFLSLNQILTAKTVPPSLVQFTNAERAANAFAQNLQIPAKEAAELLERMLLKVFPTLKPHFFPVPGAREFVHWAKSRYSLILATNPVWPIEIIRLRLEWAGLDSSLFQFITDSKSMHYCKPEEKYFSELLKIQSLNAEQVLHVGNEIQMDLPAVKAGVRVFILDRNRILKKIVPTIPEHAAAWKGTFNSLQKLLMENTL